MPFSRVAATWVASNIAGMASVLLLALRLIRLCGITTFEKTVHMITDSDEVGFKGAAAGAAVVAVGTTREGGIAVPLLKLPRAAACART